MKYETLPTEKIVSEQKMGENCISIKVNKFRQFLFKVNFGSKVYRELDINKYEQPFKIFIGLKYDREPLAAQNKLTADQQKIKNIFLTQVLPI